MTFDRAKLSVARCSLSKLEKVDTKVLGKTKKTVGEIFEVASSYEREYSFISYNCRHFVLDVLKEIV